MGIEGFRGEASFRTWVLRILHNVGVDMLRARTRSAVSSRPVDRDDEGAEPADSRPPLEDSVIARIIVQRAFAGLRLEVRQAVVLVDLLRLTQREAAKVLGVPRHVVVKLLAEGRDALRGAGGHEEQRP